jgi:signal transduction histidine kinase
MVRGASTTRPGVPFSRHRRWWWLLLLSLLILLPHLLSFAMVSAGDWPVGTSVAMLRLTATGLALAGAGLLCIHWWISGNRASAWMGAAILSLAITQIPAALLELDSATATTIGTPYTVLDTLLALPFVALLACGMGHRPINHRTTPILLGVISGSTFAAVRVAYTGFDLEERLHLSELSFPIEMIAAAVLGAVVVAILMRLDELPTWARNETIAAAIAITYGWVARVETWGASGGWQIAASAFLLAGFVILASTSVELLRVAIRENEKRIRALSDRAEAAEETLRTDEETLHELRGAIAGIGSASRILTGMSATLDSAQQHRLTDLMSLEMDRLERLLSGTRHGPEVVALDPLIASLVSAYRYVGMPIHSFASGASAWAVASDLTDVLHVLLNNAARHAPGSSTMVWVRPRNNRVHLHVSDDGPGIPAPIRDRVFDRGVRADGSPGQGLGLYIARRVLDQNGGHLQLRDDPRHGTTFVVDLPVKQPA